MNAEDWKAIEEFARQEKEKAELAKGKVGFDGVYMLHFVRSEGARAALTIAHGLDGPRPDAAWVSAVFNALRTMGWEGTYEDAEKIAQGMYRELALLGKEQSP